MLPALAVSHRGLATAEAFPQHLPLHWSLSERRVQGQLARFAGGEHAKFLAFSRAIHTINRSD
jgi:hypothetical protein